MMSKAPKLDHSSATSPLDPWYHPSLNNMLTSLKYVLEPREKSVEWSRILKSWIHIYRQCSDCSNQSWVSQNHAWSDVSKSCWHLVGHEFRQSDIPWWLQRHGSPRVHKIWQLAMQVQTQFGASELTLCIRSRLFAYELLLIRNG